MKRTIRPEEARLWSVVAATVRPSRHPRKPPDQADLMRGLETAARLPIEALKPKPKTPPAAPPSVIEPNRKRRIAREREEIAGRLDLHGYTQERARSVLHGFIERMHESGARAVLIITGKGVQGDGILRRRVPDWLAEAPSRARVAGIASADRHHGGDGALYVALKRKGR